METFGIFALTTETRIKHQRIMEIKKPIDLEICTLLNERLKLIEDKLNSDVFTYYGPIDDGLVPFVKKIIEDIASEEKHEKLSVILTTTGGSATAVERYVDIIRHFYKEVDFIVPDYAYSAGTIFCMSGDNIWMNYYSVLGPIDPQVRNKDGRWVPALGYLDKINELIKKANDGTLSNAEFIILKDFDLAELKNYEQAKELTIELLKKWLVKYKFKNWETRETSKTPVTDQYKIDRAQIIADALSNNNEWKSHGRPINIERIRALNLKIEDYGEDVEIKDAIDSYYELLDDHINRNKNVAFFHTRNFI